MGKIRAVAMGDELNEVEQRKKAEARRQTKQAKKQKIEGVGLKGGERTAVVEGTELKPEVKKLIDAVEGGKDAGKEKEERKPKVRSKRYTTAALLVDKAKLYPVSEAIAIVKKTSLTKFDGTVELHVNLNKQMLPDKGDFRLSISLPHGTGKEVKVAIADEKLIAEIESGTISFDVLVAHPSMMPKLAKVARILGPKGLMPNPKTGTVSDAPEKVAESLAKGKMNVKTEPNNPILHFPVGKVSFSLEKLTDNIDAALTTVGKNKILRATLTATMGPGVKLQIA